MDQSERIQRARRAGSLFRVQQNELAQCVTGALVELRQGLGTDKTGVVTSLGEEGSVFIEDQARPPLMPAPKFLAGGAEHRYQATGHVLTTMVANAFDTASAPEFRTQNARPPRPAANSAPLVAP